MPADIYTRPSTAPPSPGDTPAQPEHESPPDHDDAAGHSAEHDVLLDMARVLRQAPRHDNQVERTVILPEDEANALADALEQLAPRVQAMQHAARTAPPTPPTPPTPTTPQPHARTTSQMPSVEDKK